MDGTITRDDALRSYDGPLGSVSCHVLTIKGVRMDVVHLHLIPKHDTL